MTTDTIKKHVHSLEVILRCGNGDVQAVVRWCTDCGAVVVDEDVDGRTYAGALSSMRFPARNRAK